MQSADISVALAAGGPIGGDTLEVFSQFAPASMFEKIRGNSPARMQSTRVVQMATIDDAKVLGMHNDINSTIVFAVLPTDIHSVMINGKWIVENKSLTTSRSGADIGEKPRMGAEISQASWALTTFVFDYIEMFCSLKRNPAKNGMLSPVDLEN